ncbi:unnamed protein product, partial [Didymodactylos carnosus]
FRCRQKFSIVKLAGIDVVYCTKSKKPICVYESLFNIIKECHEAVSHGGRDKTLAEVNSHYSWVPKIVVEIYLKTCIAYQVRKPLKHPVVSKPIISLGVMTSLQIDLTDMRTRPDFVSSDIVYSWTLHCIDHFSKFTFAYPLKNKSPVEVTSKLRALFFSFGPPHLLHSDNGAEFVAQVIVELKTLFPDMCFIRGRPRHPQSQGCIERANGVLNGLLLVVYGINTRVSSTTKTTPYETMFGQQPRSNSDFWKIVKENRIEDEDQLPTPAESENMVEPSIIIETQSDDFDNEIREHNLNVSNLIPAMFPLLDINDSANASHVLSGSLLDLSSSFCINYHQPQSTTTNSTTPDLIAFDSPPPPSRTLTTFPQSNGLASNVLSLNGNTSTILQGQTSFINSFEPTNIFDEFLACSSQHTNLVSISASHSQTSPSTLTASYLATSSSLPPRHADARRKAADNNLETANKKRKLYDEHLSRLAEQYKILR